MNLNEVEIMVLEEVIEFFYANYAENAVSKYDLETLYNVKQKLAEDRDGAHYIGTAIKEHFGVDDE